MDPLAAFELTSLQTLNDLVVGEVVTGFFVVVTAASYLT